MKDMDKTKEQLIEEARRQEETLRRYAERIDLMNKIDRTILIAQSPEEIAASALHYLNRLVIFQWASIILLDLEAIEIILLAPDQHEDATGLEPGQRLSLNPSEVVPVLQQGQPHLIEDTRTLAERSQIGQQSWAAGMRTCLIIPLICRSVLIGSFNLGATTPDAFSTEQTEIAQTVADQIAIAIQNAQLYTETQRRAEEMASLNTVSQAITASLDLQEILHLITEHTNRLLKVAATSVALYDQERNDLWFATAVGRGAEFIQGKRLPLEQGVVGWVVQHGEPVLVSDAKQDSRHFPDFDHEGGFTTQSILCVPLQAKGQVTGAIEAINKQDGPYTDADQRLLQSLAASAAIAIENARLFQQAQGELAERKQAQKALRQAHDELEQRVEQRTAELAKANGHLREEIHERKRIERELRQSEARNQAILNAIPDLMLRFNQGGTVLDAFASTQEDLVLPPTDFLGKNVREILPLEISQEILKSMRQTLQDGQMQLIEYQLPLRGNPQDFEARFVASGEDEILAIVRNITDRKMFEKQLFQSAFHDTLTGLPNRASFLKRLDQVVEQTQHNPDYTFALLFLDLDQFKVVNDSLGHAVGDELLIIIARRLEVCVRPDDLVARLGGDEFTILLNDIKNIDGAKRVADRIHRELGKPVDLDGHQIFPSTSIGITLGTKKYKRPEDVLRDADIAMYGAKAEGRARHKLFDTGQHTRAMVRLRLEGDLWQAMKRQEFRVYYQPIISLSSGRITGVEALLRWEHPQRGIIQPGEFISLVEETGLIVPLGDWILEKACTQIKSWHVAGHAALRVAVNISARQFQQRHLLTSLNKLLEDIELPPQTLELEIMGQAITKNNTMIMDALYELKTMGVRISVDDFGTGSSVGLLQYIPTDTLKIDQAFIKRMTDDDEAIVTAIIAMAHSLKMKVIAEGVTTKEQMAFLRSQKCDEIQGYYFSPPIPAESLTKLLEEQ